MKKQLSFLAMLIAAGSFSAPALAVDHYVSANGGVNWMGDVTALGLEAGMDNGYSVIGAVGCDYGSYRLEAEAGFADNNLDSYGGTKYEGNASVHSLMANACYDIDTGDGITPYLTAGVGVAQVGGHNIRPEGSSDSPFSTRETTMAWQVGAGVAIPLTSTLDLDARYRYFATTDFTVQNAGNIDIDSHSVLLGFRMKF